MSNNELPANELVFRKRVLQAIRDGFNKDGMKTADIVIAVIELARIAAEGSILTCPKETRPELCRLLHKIITAMAEHLRDFEPTPEDEALAKGRQVSNAWGNKREVH